jgi:hypothetical protein
MERRRLGHRGSRQFSRTECLTDTTIGAAVVLVMSEGSTLHDGVDLLSRRIARRPMKRVQLGELW